MRLYKAVRMELVEQLFVIRKEPCNEIIRQRHNIHFLFLPTGVGMLKSKKSDCSEVFIFLSLGNV